MVAEAVRFPDLTHALWRSGNEQPALVLPEWITHQQEEGVLLKGPPTPPLARQFVDLAVTDVQFRALIGIPDAFKHDKALRVAIDTFLRGQATGSSGTGAEKK